MFLTTIPLPGFVRAGCNLELTPALAWFPLIGAGVGAIAGALRLVCVHLFGRGPSTALAMIVLVIFTGALHQDGLADTADGLGVRGDRDRRLAAMRDSATGAFGVLALIGWTLLLFTAVEPLTASRGLLTLVTAGAASRLAALLHGFIAPPARQDGLGAALHVTALPLAVAAASATVIVLAAAGPAKGAVCLGVCVLISGLSAVSARRAIGGRTGDTLGATVALTEVAVCLSLVAMWRG